MDWVTHKVREMKEFVLKVGKREREEEKANLV